MIAKGFEEFYEKNKNYFFVKHGGDEKKMRSDAMSAHGEILRFKNAPKNVSGKVSKKKPNPYGFN